MTSRAIRKKTWYRGLERHRETKAKGKRRRRTKKGPGKRNRRRGSRGAKMDFSGSRRLIDIRPFLSMPTENRSGANCVPLGGPVELSTRETRRGRSHYPCENDSSAPGDDVPYRSRRWGSQKAARRSGADKLLIGRKENDEFFFRFSFVPLIPRCD